MDPQHDVRPLAHGTEVGAYRIGDRIGRGDAGITYAAIRRSDGRRVAIKEYAPRGGAVRRDDNALVPWPAATAERFHQGRRRFHREAALLCELDHPNIVRARECREANGTAYLIMDHYAGYSLAELIGDPGFIDELEIRAIIAPLCDALRYLHRRGVIHRDLKPANIIVREDGRPMLIDFGAAARGDDSAADDVSITSRCYCPCERYSRRVSDQGPWTDLYALGATLYSVISGTQPIDAPTRRRHLQATGHDPLVTAASRLAGRYSDRLLSAIDQALALNPRARPATINAWHDALD